jgi:hypothetical protein
MAFLDNSGDIILDAVLTDYGRAKLASGSMGGRFVNSFGLFDDEINYGLYNFLHPSGSAYFDLDIMQTPVLEAFTNNASSAKYALYATGLSDKLFYLPIMKLNTDTANTVFCESSTNTTEKDSIIAGAAVTSNTILLLADSTTKSDTTVAGGGTGTLVEGNYLYYGGGGEKPVRVDIGIDNSAAESSYFSTFPELKTRNTILYYDSRLIRIHRVTDKKASTALATPMSQIAIDDDNIATSLAKYGTSATDPDVSVFIPNAPYNLNSSNIAGKTNFDAALLLKLDVVPDIQSSDYYFSLLGTTETIGGVSNVKTITTNIQVVSQETGVSVTIPIKICKV